MSSLRDGPDPEVKVLSISPSDADTISLRRILSHSAWSLEDARTLAEALQKLTADPIPVVFCNHRLPDASWHDVLTETAKMPHRPNVIVASPLPDDKLWMEVLDSGAYDLLGKPFKADEVFRIISLAWLQWKQRLRQQGRRPPSTASAERPAACPPAVAHR